jgi:hypothetical protein
MPVKSAIGSLIVGFASPLMTTQTKLATNLITFPLCTNAADWKRLFLGDLYKALQTGWSSLLCIG